MIPLSRHDERDLDIGNIYTDFVGLIYTSYVDPDYSG